MTIYLEPPTHITGGPRFSRLRADDPAELDAFVTAAGLGDARKVTHRTIAALTHYELTARQRRTAARAGATKVDWSSAYQRIGRTIVDATRPDQATHTRYGLRTTPRLPTPPGPVIDPTAPVQVTAASIVKRPFRRTRTTTTTRVATRPELIELEVLPC
ncbi:MAG: DUF4031 domain-containing protein [Acidimicrobiales bacterium]